MDPADVDVEVDLLAEPFVAYVAGEGALLVVHQTLVLVEHCLQGRDSSHKVSLNSSKIKIYKSHKIFHSDTTPAKCKTSFYILTEIWRQ